METFDISRGLHIAFFATAAVVVVAVTGFATAAVVTVAVTVTAATVTVVHAGVGVRTTYYTRSDIAKQQIADAVNTMRTPTWRSYLSCSNFGTRCLIEF